MYYKNSSSGDIFYEGLVQAMSPVSERYPPSWPGDADALVCTFRDLTQHPDRVMSEIEKSGHPGFITRDGCFVAIITPLAPGQVESRVLGETARQISQQDCQRGGPAGTADRRWLPASPAWR